MTPTRKQFWIGLDQWINTWFRGWADETISARCWRNKDKKKRWNILFRMVNAIFFWQNNHCHGAYQDEMLRQHMPEEYRSGKWKA